MLRWLSSTREYVSSAAAVSAWLEQPTRSSCSDDVVSPVTVSPLSRLDDVTHDVEPSSLTVCCAAAALTKSWVTQPSANLGLLGTSSSLLVYWSLTTA